MQDVIEVRLDLGPPGAFVKSRFGPAQLHRAATEHRGRDAVEHGRVVQLHERIRILPMTTWGMAAIDDRDVDVSVVDERVGERHAHRPCAHDQVVGL
jgi:hypothetical protein